MLVVGGGVLHGETCPYGACVRRNGEQPGSWRGEWAPSFAPMLRSYLPALVFVALGGGIGIFFVVANTWLGARARPRRAVAEPYECGMPSDFKRNSRFGVSFYLVGILFLIFDLEVLLLFPVALQLEAFGLHALGAIGLFLLLLGVALVYDWSRGALEWRDEE
jgi:NADH-quinone oxidoreductase subunit A